MGLRRTEANIGLPEKDLEHLLSIFNSERIKMKIVDYISALTNEAVMTAKQEAPIRSGDLRNNIYGVVERKGGEVNGAVYATSGHAAFVEFGTGIVGEGTYPNDTDGYEYNVPSPFKDESGGWFWGSTYTHGYEANPFMYRTVRHLINVAGQIAEGMPDDNK